MHSYVLNSNKHIQGGTLKTTPRQGCLLSHSCLEIDPWAGKLYYELYTTYPSSKHTHTKKKREKAKIEREKKKDPTVVKQQICGSR